MFTGIIQALGKVIEVQKNTGQSQSIRIQLPNSIQVEIGGSIAVNGACLTAKEVRQNVILCDCIPETVKLTTLGGLTAGEEVNLELPLTLQSPLGGHLVQGHVDGVGTIVSIRDEENSRLMSIELPPHLAKFLVPKGSITLDGVSLTIIEASSQQFSVGLIPLTQQATILGRKSVGAKVNVEIDAVSKMIHRFMEPYLPQLENKL